MTTENEKSVNPTEDSSPEFTLESLLQVIEEAPDIKSIKRTLSKQILDVFQVEVAALFLVNNNKQELTSWLLLPEESSEKIVMPIQTSSIVGYVASKKIAANIRDPYNPMELRRIGPELNFSDSYDKKANIRSKQILAVPVLQNNTPLAVIELINKKDDSDFTYHDENAVNDLARVLATAFFIHSNLGIQALPQYESILAQKLLSRKDLIQGLEKATELGEDPDTVLMNTFEIPRLKMGEMLAEYYSTSFVDLKEVDNDPKKLFEGINIDYFEEQELVPLSLNDEKLTVAVKNIEDQDLTSTIMKKVPGANRVELVFAFQEDIRSFWERTRAKHVSSAKSARKEPQTSFDSSIFDLLDDDAPQIRSNYSSDQQMQERRSSYSANIQGLQRRSSDSLGDYEPQIQSNDRQVGAKPQRQSDGGGQKAQSQVRETQVRVIEREVRSEKPVKNSDEYNAPQVVLLVDEILEGGCSAYSSDIHIEPYGDQKDGEVRYRIDGVCTNALKIPSQYVQHVIDKIKSLASLNLEECTRPQDGKMNFTTSEGKEVELRVTTIPTANSNEDIVLQVLSDPIHCPSLEELIPAQILDPFIKMIEKEEGLILVVGPNISGKTTTLHSALAHLNKAEKKIWTAEYPVEIEQPRIRQVQVDPLMNYTFPVALRAFLRADPDVIMVSDMYDQQTASMVVDAALDGHLLLSSLSVNSAGAGIVQCLKMGIDPLQFAKALHGIVAQRLVRTLCKHCKEPYHPEKAEFDRLLENYGVSFFDHINVMYSDSLVFYRANGCPKCNDSGYRGRTGLYELLVVNPTIKKMIMKRASLGEIVDEAMINNMTLLLQEGIQLIFDGTIDLKELISVCPL